MQPRALLALAMDTAYREHEASGSLAATLEILTMVPDF